MTNKQREKMYAEGRAHLKAVDPVMAEMVDADPGLNPRRWMSSLPKLDAFGALIFQVIGQQISVAATRAILGRIVTYFGGRLPTPEEVLATDPEEMRKMGLSGSKARTIRAIAEAFVNGDISIAKLRKMDDDQVEAELTKIKGVGPWTAHGFLIIFLERPDAFMPGDLALRKAVMRMYNLPEMPSIEEMVEIAERWRPHRRLATSYLFASFFMPRLVDEGLSTAPAS